MDQIYIIRLLQYSLVRGFNLSLKNGQENPTMPMLALTPTPSLLEIVYAVAMSLKGHFFRLAFFFIFFSRIKYFQPGLLRISLRLSWWSLFVCRLLKRGHIVPKRKVYFRENLWDKIRGYWWLNPKVSVKVQSDTLYIFSKASSS